MSSSNYYKELCTDLKQDLKRKKRELEDSDDRVRKCEAETKKAKIEAQEILKLYHGIQRELQLAYERNAKLQVDKVSYEGLLDGERKEFEAFKRQQSTSTDENKKLKDALCAMRTEKLELETKFNAIVMENKDLRDRARQYEPRLREMDEIKKKLAQVEQLISEQLQPEIRSQNELAQRAQIKQEQIDRYAKWNDLLKRECDEKSQQLKRYDELFEYSRRLEEEKATLQIQLDQLKSDSQSSINSSPNFDDILLRIRQIRSSVDDLKEDFKKEFANCTEKFSAALVALKELSPESSVNEAETPQNGMSTVSPPQDT